MAHVHRPSRSFLSLLSLLAGPALLAACGGGGGGSDWPSSPTVTATRVRGSAYYPGAVVEATSTIESGTQATQVPVGIYLKKASDPATCAGLATLPVTWATLESIAAPGGDKPAAHDFHDRFSATRVVWEPGTQNRRAVLERTFRLPDVPPGEYRVATAVQAGQADCKFAEGTIRVQPRHAPDILHSTARLHRNSFRLQERIIAKRRIPGPDFSLSSEIANTGLDLSVPLEFGFDLEISGKSYALLSESISPAGVRQLVERHVVLPATGGVTFPSGAVKARTFSLYLPETAKTALRGLAQDTPAKLHVRVDPDAKVDEIDKANDEVTLPVMYLAGSSTCTPSDPSYVAPTTGGNGPSNLVFCFGPDAPAADHFGDPDGFLYVAWQFGGSEADPAYFFYNMGTAASPMPFPTTARFHTASLVNFQALGGKIDSRPLDALVDLAYRMPPTLDTSKSPAQYQFAEWNSYLRILGDTIFDKSGGVWLQSAYDFDWFKKEKKWKVFQDTVMVDIVPVTFDLGAQGEIGLAGTADVAFDQTDFNASLDLSIGPYLTLSAYGEASVFLLVASVGVGVELDLLSINPKFEPSVKFFAAVESSASTGQKQVAAAAELAMDLPLTLKSGDGEFYLFVKFLGHEHKKSIVDWDGYSHTFDLMSPLTFYVGPVGLFFVTGGDTATSGAVYRAQPPSGSAGTQWVGSIALDAGDYTFWWQNTDWIQLNGSNGKLVLAKTSEACDGVSTNPRSQVVTIPAKGTYTLQASVSSCKAATASKPTQVWWVANGQAAVAGLSGTAGYGTSGGGSGVVGAGTPACAVQTWFYNQNPSVAGPASYQCGEAISFDYAYDQAVSDTPPVNPPMSGLWVRQQASIPLGIVQNGIAVQARANVPYADSSCGTVTDDLAITLTDGGSFFRQFTGPVGADGTVLWNVPKVAGGPAGPLTLETQYHSKYPGDFPAKCITPWQTPQNDARLQLVVGPVGAWLVESICTSGLPVSSLKPGPAVASQGTLGGGSLFTENLCKGAGRAPAGEAVVGVFDFGANGATYDFFVGATAVENLKVWIDGVPVTSRTVTNGPASPTDCPSAGGACATREKHFTQFVGPGLHFVEAWFDYSPGMSSTTTEHRIRWSPAQANEALVSFYANNRELGLAVYGNPTLTPVSGPDTTTATIEPLMVLKYPAPASASAPRVAFSWASVKGAGDCTADAAVGGQLDCWNALGFVAGGPGAVPFVVDGTYSLTDQVPYFFQGLTSPGNNRAIDFWVDNQQFVNYSAYWPFPDSGQLFAYVQNLQASDGTTGAPPDLHELRFVSSPLASGLPTAQFSATWESANPNSYATVFLDGNNQLLGYSLTNDLYGGLGVSQSQKLVSAGGGGGAPQGTCHAYLISPVQGDPGGLYYALQGSQGVQGAIDLFASLDVTNVPATGFIGDQFDLCLNGTCRQQAQGPLLSGSPVQMKSTDLLSYNANQGLFSQQFNNLLVHLWNANNPGGCLTASPVTGPAKYLLTLTYQAHSW